MADDEARRRALRVSSTGLFSFKGFSSQHVWFCLRCLSNNFERAAPKFRSSGFFANGDLSRLDEGRVKAEYLYKSIPTPRATSSLNKGSKFFLDQSQMTVVWSAFQWRQPLQQIRRTCRWVIIAIQKSGESSFYSITFIYMFAHSVIIAIQKSGESSFYSITFIYMFAHSIFLVVK